MKTEKEIQEIKEQLAEIIDSGFGICCDAEDIVRAAETADNFKSACINYGRCWVDDDYCDDYQGKLTIIEKSQRVSGERRTDLYILEVEENLTLVYKS
jgi:hypothetical protein